MSKSQRNKAIATTTFIHKISLNRLGLKRLGEALSIFMNKFYFSSKKILLLCIFSNVTSSIVNIATLSRAIDIDVFYRVQMFFAFSFIVIFFHTLAWHTGFKKSYVGVNDIGIEITTIVFCKTYKYFIPWSRITKVRYINLLFSKDLYVYGDRDLRYIYPPSIRLSLIDTAKFKAAVIAQTHPENPLHEALIKYL